MFLDALLETMARRYGFSYGVQSIGDLAFRMDAEGDDFAASVLTASEYDHFKRYRFRKRQVEWLAGRMAAKAAFARYYGDSSDGRFIQPVSVGTRSTGAPYLVGHPDLTVSITHSHDYAIAVIAGYAIGLDLEKIEPRPAALAEFFFSPDEQNALEAGGDDEVERLAVMTMVWSRKEALVKLLKTGSAINFKRVNTLPDRVRIHDRPLPGVRLVSESRGGYAISLALGR